MAWMYLKSELSYYGNPGSSALTNSGPPIDNRTLKLTNRYQTTPNNSPLQKVGSPVPESPVTPPLKKTDTKLDKQNPKDLSLSADIMGFDNNGFYTVKRTVTVADDFMDEDGGVRKRTSQLGAGSKVPIGPTGDIFNFFPKSSKNGRTGYFDVESSLRSRRYGDIYTSLSIDGLGATYVTPNQQDPIGNEQPVKIAPIDNLYNRFKVHAAIHDPFGIGAPPVILRGLQRDENSDTQLWGVGGTGTGIISSLVGIPRAGITVSGAIKGAENERQARWEIGPRGTAFRTKQKVLGMMATTELQAGGIGPVLDVLQKYETTQLQRSAGGQDPSAGNLQLNLQNEMINQPGDNALGTGVGYTGQQINTLSMNIGGPGSSGGIGGTLSTRSENTKLSIQFQQKSPLELGGWSTSDYKKRYGLVDRLDNPDNAQINYNKPYADINTRSSITDNVKVNPDNVDGKGEADITVPKHGSLKTIVEAEKFSDDKWDGAVKNREKPRESAEKIKDYKTLAYGELPDRTPTNSPKYHDFLKPGDVTTPPEKELSGQSYDQVGSEDKPGSREAVWPHNRGGSFQEGKGLTTPADGQNEFKAMGYNEIGSPWGARSKPTKDGNKKTDFGGGYGDYGSNPSYTGPSAGGYSPGGNVSKKRWEFDGDNTDQNPGDMKFEFEGKFGGSGTVKFKAYLTSLNEAFAPGWEGAQDQGRADARYLYTTFERTVSFEFAVDIHNKDKFKEVWEKLQKLALMTYPIYKSQGFHGEITKVTLGKMYEKVPMIITDLTYDWDNETPWELDSSYHMPMRTTVSLSCTILGDGEDAKKFDGEKSKVWSYFG